VKAQGWYHDPFRRHEDRYFSDGQPTKLVRDGEAEDYDPPPPGRPEVELVEESRIQPKDGDDLRRADDPSAGPVTSDERPFWAVLEGAAVWGPVN